ncbi:MAG: 30S ribosomal protein S16 [Spirochaetes bacterium]|uniref:Small ribosomal subunit protein bS16 n=1 Tax=candidate division CPR3 bacterium 4484_211 TaxID=1968527 RepID=A0A1W9NZ12_UNCC3|nr:MAG: 30S ribosomal protein S16 [candidate division CPR3 bacterium 4484_211]RKX81460.1 MAG: 30S ribosomal protein S16 [Spirochaetota bacterium]
MLKIRLSRTGRKHYASYRIVVIDARRKRDGRCLETIGHYNPQINPPRLEYKKDRLEYWTGKGAQMSEGVRKILAI